MSKAEAQLAHGRTEETGAAGDPGRSSWGRGLRFGPASSSPIQVSAIVAPLLPPERLMELFPEEPAFLWDSLPGQSVCALGVTEAVELEPGPPGQEEDRFAALQGRAEALLARTRSSGPKGAPSPRLYGGIAFCPGAPPDPAWRELGDARFVLPRLSYTRAEGSAYLCATSSPEQEDRPRVEAELRRIARALVELRPRPSTPPRLAWRERVSQEQYAALVGQIARELEAGRFRKIVAAHRATVEGDAALCPLALLRRLEASGSDGIRFAIRGAETTFLGVTPERLLTRSGARVRSEALAGTAPPAGGVEGSAPGFSRKDKREHRMVVESLVETLRAHCGASLVYPSEPGVRQLRRVRHLHTPIEGELERPVHVLELVRALHPTPAVAGTPRRAARDWIVAHEPASRGWYAGTLGWFDGAGDGEFAVALRCALLDGARALVYAGAGIVEGSVAALEFAETTLKQRTIAEALGLVP